MTKFSNILAVSAALHSIALVAYMDYFDHENVTYEEAHDWATNRMLENMTTNEQLSWWSQMFDEGLVLEVVRIHDQLEPILI
jgi:hypothetical protein